MKRLLLAGVLAITAAVGLAAAGPTPQVPICRCYLKYVASEWVLICCV